MILILSWVIQLLKNIMIFLGCIAIRDGIEYSEIFSKSIQKCYDKIKNYNILHQYLSISGQHCMDDYRRFHKILTQRHFDE